MTTRAAAPVSWTNLTFLLTAHLLAVAGVLYLVLVHFDPRTVALAGLWLVLCTLSISAGYHRLFSHRSYVAWAPLRALYLLFGAASVQNSALAWCSDHREHHTWTDTDRDPYDSRRGFWWSHVGWVVFDLPGPELDRPAVKDLRADPLVLAQHKWYLPIAILMGAVVPMAIAGLWGDLLGGLLCVGFLRLVVQWHMTFSINSFAHLIGTRPYCENSSARDSWITAIITMGEGYHNFHHRFPLDYRNGRRWFDFDATKWFVWTLSHLRITRGLRRTSPEAIRKARDTVRASAAAR